MGPQKSLEGLLSSFSSRKKSAPAWLQSTKQKLTASPLSASDSDMRNFLKYLGRADEDIAEEIGGKSKFASDLSKFVRQSEGEGSVSLKAAAGPVQKILAKYETANFIPTKKRKV